MPVPAYQHVVVVMSIVLGLAVTQLLRGIAQVYRARARVRPYWLHGAWVALLLVFSLFLWWTYWNYRDITEWNFPLFVLYVSPAMVFSFATALAFPDPAEPARDMREYYFSNRAGLFGTLALYGLVAGATAVVVRGLAVLDPSNLVRVLLVALLVAAMRSSSERVHAVVLVLCASLFLVFVALFQFRIG